jgi:hypothetical protein
MGTFNSSGQKPLMANWYSNCISVPGSIQYKKQGSESSSLSEPNLSSTPEIPGTEIGARPPSTMFRLPEKTKSRHDEVICPQPLFIRTSIIYTSS